MRPINGIEFHPREFSFPATVRSVFSLGSPALDGMLLSSLLETEIRTTLALTCLSRRGCDDELVVLDPVVTREGAGAGGGGGCEGGGGWYWVPIEVFVEGGTWPRVLRSVRDVCRFKSTPLRKIELEKL